MIVSSIFAFLFLFFFIINGFHLEQSSILYYSETHMKTQSLHLQHALLWMPIHHSFTMRRVESLYNIFETATATGKKWRLVSKEENRGNDWNVCEKVLQALGQEGKCLKYFPV